MSVYDESLKLHEKYHGKLKVEAKVPCEDAKDLSLAYTPGVAEPCRKIHEDKEMSYVYTNRANTVAVISDGTAVLGLGDIGAEAALPVMEGKSLLMKRFADIDSWPLVIDSKDTEEIIRFCKMVAPSFGAINLEDISAPRCVEIERKPEEQKVVISGCGAAGSSIIRMLYQYGFHKIYAFDVDGCLDPDHSEGYNDLKKELLCYVNLDHQHYASLKEAMAGADIFIGVSAPRIVTKEMVASMNEGNIVFAMANPEPEITYEEVKEAGAYIIGTGRSDYPNQVNNLLAFPGLFRGALDAKATKITEEMKIAASIGIASLIKDEELTREHIIVSPFDPRVVPTVADAVKKEAIKSGFVRK